jgi:hypothetical protein
VADFHSWPGNQENSQDLPKFTQGRRSLRPQGTDGPLPLDHITEKSREKLWK